MNNTYICSEMDNDLVLFYTWANKEGNGLKAYFWFIGLLTKLRRKLLKLDGFNTYYLLT